MKTIILEDSASDLELLKILLSKHCPAVKVIGETGRIEEAIELITALRPALLFLDVEVMGRTSFDLLDQLQKLKVPFDFEIIFMTGHKNYDYATTAFSYSALDFLTKIIDPVRLKQVVDKALTKHNPQQYAQQLLLFMELVKSTDTTNARMAVNLVKGVIEFIDVAAINYLEADGVMTIFHFIDNRPVLKSVSSLGHFVKMLKDNSDFISISNSLTINYKELHSYRHSDKEVVLKSGKILRASRRDGHELNSRIKANPLDSNSNPGFFKRLFGR
jgi:two-component system LytT family response regulator